MNLSDQKINFSWQLSLILFLLISPMFFGPLIALLNPEFFEGLGDKELSLGSTLFVARNLAIGLAFLFAIYMRSASMLFILILVRLIIDLIDFPAFQIFREPSLFGQIIIFSLMCYLPAYFGLRILWKEIKNPTSKTTYAYYAVYSEYGRFLCYSEITNQFGSVFKEHSF